MDLILGALKIVSTGNSSISFRVFRYSHVPQTNGSEHNDKKIVLFVRSGTRRRRGGAGLLSGAVGIVLLDWCRKIYKSDLSLIFFCILDEAATNKEAAKVL